LKAKGCGNLLADTEKMDDNKEEPSGGVDMAAHFDRDTKVAYVEQIESGKLTVTEAVRELGCSRSTIYSWIKKLSEDGEHALPGSGHMKPDLEHQRRLERENKQLKNEIEFLKKAAAYFAGDQRKGTR
jgi:transposase